MAGEEDLESRGITTAVCDIARMQMVTRALFIADGRLRKENEMWVNECKCARNVNVKCVCVNVGNNATCKMIKRKSNGKESPVST